MQVSSAPRPSGDGGDGGRGRGGGGDGGGQVGDGDEPALLFRLLWLIDLQLQHSQAGGDGDARDTVGGATGGGGGGGGGGDGGGQEGAYCSAGDDGVGGAGGHGVGLWNAERLCQRLRLLPSRLITVRTLSSLFYLLLRLT